MVEGFNKVHYNPHNLRNRMIIVFRFITVINDCNHCHHKSSLVEISQYFYARHHNLQASLLTQSCWKLSIIQTNLFLSPFHPPVFSFLFLGALSTPHDTWLDPKSAMEHKKNCYKNKGFRLLHEGKMLALLSIFGIKIRSLNSIVHVHLTKWHFALRYKRNIQHMSIKTKKKRACM